MSKEVKMLFYLVDEESLETIVAIPAMVCKNPVEARLWASKNVEEPDEIIEIMI